MLKRPLLAFVAAALLVGGLLAASLLVGQRPLLGLDLKGGVEVVLEPIDTPENLALATDENLDLAVEILRKRVDAIGVAEPDITTQTGGNSSFIIVQLPGIENTDEAVALVGQTAQLQFRPVLFDLTDRDALASLDPATEIFDDTITNGGPGLLDLLDFELSDPNDTPPDQSAVFLTSADDSGAAAPILVGPTLFTGSALSGAEPQFINGQWLVEVTFKAGADGLDLFNEAAALCFSPTDACPFRRLAFVLDGVVESSPTINSNFFESRDVVITRDQGFPEDLARNTALVLDFGALPLAFEDPADPTAGLVRTVSATLGRDSLNAGLIAGALGVALVALYITWYYRLLGVAALLSLVLSGSMLWVILSFLSTSRGLALTLAGIVGLVVSIGVSLDSNIIFFEDLKDTVKRGGQLQASVDRSFPGAFSTVFWANMATLIGASILYFLTVGSVKGFALMLGIASILDLVATYVFMAPLVKLLVGRFGDRPALFGIRERSIAEVAA